MSSLARASILPLLCPILACSRSAPQPQAPGPKGQAFDKRVEDHFGADVCRTVMEADRVEVLRIEVNGFRRDQTGFRALGEPVVPPASWVESLRRVLASARTYGWETAKPCIMRPGVAVNFSRTGREAQLLLCFECTMLALGSPGDPLVEDFDPARSALVRLVKEVFPKDPVIQELKEEK